MNRSNFSRSNFPTGPRRLIALGGLAALLLGASAGRALAQTEGADLLFNLEGPNRSVIAVEPQVPGTDPGVLFLRTLQAPFAGATPTNDTGFDVYPGIDNEPPYGQNQDQFPFQRVTIQQVAISNGLTAFYQYNDDTTKVFGPAAQGFLGAFTLSQTQVNPVQIQPDEGLYYFHQHFDFMAAAPGTYNFDFKVVNAVNRAGGAVPDSQIFRITYVNPAPEPGAVAGLLVGAGGLLSLTLRRRRLQPRRLAGGVTAVLVLGGLLAAPQASHAQTTAIGIRAVPTTTSVTAGSTVTFSFFLDVTGIAPGDNYTGSNNYFVYSQTPGSGPAVSPFTTISLLTNTTTSGFTATNLNDPARAVTTGGVSYLGLRFDLSSAPTLRTDTGTFLIGAATGQLRPDLAAGTYPLAFVNFPPQGPSRVVGKFGAGGVATFPNFTTQGFTLSVAAAPEPSGTVALGLGCLGAAWLILRRRRTAPAA